MIVSQFIHDLSVELYTSAQVALIVLSSMLLDEMPENDIAGVILECRHCMLPVPEKNISVAVLLILWNHHQPGQDKICSLVRVLDSDYSANVNGGMDCLQGNTVDSGYCRMIGRVFGDRRGGPR